MNKQQLDQAIAKVAKTQGITKKEVAAKLMQKDNWTHFLVRQSLA